MATTEFQEEYLKLLIFQYQDKPKAYNEILTKVKLFEKIYDLHQSFEVEFDLDTARGVQLDILGKIVGISRNVNNAIAKEYFGFIDENINAKTFGEGPFKKLDDLIYSDLQLNDSDYRFLIRAKVGKNNTDADIVSLNKTITFMFKDKGFVVDNFNMALTLYIDETFDIRLLKVIRALDLLPKPQGVRYNKFRTFTKGKTFGFFNVNPDSKTFGEGKFARILNL